MGARYSMYNEHIYSLQHFFLNPFFTYGQAGWPRTFMSGTVGNFISSEPLYEKIFLEITSTP
jgi:hypothetical protein